MEMRPTDTEHTPRLTLSIAVQTRATEFVPIEHFIFVNAVDAAVNTATTAAPAAVVVVVIVKFNHILKYDALINSNNKATGQISVWSRIA